MAARIGRVEESVFGHGSCYIGIDDAGLDDGDAILQIDFENAIQPGQRQDDAALGGYCSARKPSPGAAWNDWDVGSLRRLDHGGHLLDIRGQHDDLRHDLKDRPVLFVDNHVFLFEQKIILADDGAQLMNESVPAHRKEAYLRSRPGVK